MRAPSGLCVTTGADDRRLIEDYLPPDVLNAIASKEKLHPRRYVELVHYWPARRPITASRAAVYAALAPAPKSDAERVEAGSFVASLAAYRPDREVLGEARERIPTSHGGRAPKVLDLFAGGGAILRRAVRYLLAVERARSKSREHNLTDTQKSQLREREATEKAAAESALLKLYNEVLLPGSAKGALSLNVVSMGGRPLRTTLDEKKHAQIHQRLLELLTTVQRKVFGTVAPGKIVDLFKLGAPESDSPGIQTDKVVAGCFSFLGFPRLQSEDIVRKAIARGVESGLFGYATGRPALDDTGRYQIDRSRVAFERGIADDEIDLDSGFLMLPAALPEQPAATTSTTDGASAGEDTTYPEPGGTARIREKPDTASEGKLSPDETPGELTISFTASRNDFYAAWNALANLADMAGRVAVTVKATSDAAFDKARIENGVLEPLRELGLLDDQQS